jgi:hypothetical protein
MTIDGGLRKLFREHFPEAQWTSIETSTEQGVPDAEACFPGGLQCWIEFKRTGANAVLISPEQVAWAERRMRLGGRVFLAVRQQAFASVRRQPVDALYLYRGNQTRAVMLNGLKTPVLSHWEGGPAKWSWVKIKGLLTGKITG